MNRKNKVILYLTLITQALVFLVSLFIYQEISLLHYINISFIISSLFIFFSLTIFVINTGFFDVTARSFRLILTKDRAEDIRPFSQIITVNYSPILISGVIQFLFMLATLFIYYI